MIVTVLLFASYADALGAPTIQLDLPASSTVSDLVGRLLALPGAERLPPLPLVAVNQHYVKADHDIRGGDEIAVIPPVAGG